MRSGGKHILSTSAQLSTGVRVARCDAVSRLLVAKSDGLLVHREHRRNIRPFDRVVGASRLTHEHLMRANEALTSPMAWFLAWASRSNRIIPAALSVNETIAAAGRPPLDRGDAWSPRDSSWHTCTPT